MHSTQLDMDIMDVHVCVLGKGVGVIKKKRQSPALKSIFLGV